MQTDENIDQLVTRFIRESNMNFRYNNNQFSSQELCILYEFGMKIRDTYITIRDTTNLALFATNIYYWKLTDWQSNYIIPVTASGFIWLRNTKLFNNSLRYLSCWLSGWNNRKTIRTGINTAKYETVINLIANIGLVGSLSWKFSRLTWILCMPSTITGIFTGALGYWGLNIILASENRIIDFLTEFIVSLGNDLDINNLTSIANNTGTPGRNFEELVDLRLVEEAQTCSICMQDDRTEIARIKSCQHEFCIGCLREWYNQPVTVFNCPLCRITLDTPISNEPVIRNLLRQIFG